MLKLQLAYEVIRHSKQIIGQYDRVSVKLAIVLL